MERLGSHLYEKITGKVVFFFCATHVIISYSIGEGGGRHLRPLLNLLGTWLHILPAMPLYAYRHLMSRFFSISSVFAIRE